MMKLLDWLDDPCSHRGIRFADDDPAAGWSSYSYSDLAHQAFGVAGALTERGLCRGGVVSMVLTEPHDFVCAFYGTLVAGGTASPLAPPTTFRSLDAYTKQLAGVLSIAEPSVVLAAPHLVDTVTAALSLTSVTAPVLAYTVTDLSAGDLGARQPTAEDVVLQFTSGSSGTPKGVVVSADNLDANTGAVGAVMELRSDDVMVSWLPHYHDMGLVGGLLTPIRYGADIRILKPTHFVRSPMRWLECLGRDGGSTTIGPSFGYAYTARRVTPADIEPLDFSGWRLGLIGAERTDIRGIGAFVSLAQPRGFSPDVLQVGYGLAEATLGVSATAAGCRAPMVRLAGPVLRDGAAVDVVERAALGDTEFSVGNWVTSCGFPMLQTEVTIVGDSGQPVPDGWPGQIRVRGNGVARGYKGTPHSLTSTVFDGTILNTGDSGFLLDGQLYVVGRSGDSIKVRGRWLFAEDLDIVIGQVSGLNPGRCASVLGSTAGADVVAAIVEADHLGWLSPVCAALSAVVGEDTAIAVFRGAKGSIERTSSGKPRRRVLWQRLLDGDLDAHLIHTNWTSLSTQPVPWPQQQPVAGSW